MNTRHLAWLALVGGCHLLLDGAPLGCLDGEAAPGEFCYLQRAPVPGGGEIRQLVSGDLNGDGAADVVSLNVDGSTTIFLREGEGFAALPSGVEGAAFVSLAEEGAEGGPLSIFWLTLAGPRPSAVVRGVIDADGLRTTSFALDPLAFGDGDHEVTSFAVGDFCAAGVCAPNDDPEAEVVLSLRQAAFPYAGNTPPPGLFLDGCADDGCRVWVFELESSADPAANVAFFASSNLGGESVEGVPLSEDRGEIVRLGVQDLDPNDPENQAEEFFTLNALPLSSSSPAGERSLDVFINQGQTTKKVLALPGEARDVRVKPRGGAASPELFVLHQGGVEIFSQELNLSRNPGPGDNELRVSARSVPVALGAAEPISLAVDDFDGDGAEDLLLAANAAGQAEFYFLAADGAGGFAAPVRFFFAGTSFSGVEALPVAGGAADLFFSFADQAPFVLFATP